MNHVLSQPQDDSWMEEMATDTAVDMIIKAIDIAGSLTNVNSKLAARGYLINTAATSREFVGTASDLARELQIWAAQQRKQ